MNITAQREKTVFPGKFQVNSQYNFSANPFVVEQKDFNVHHLQVFESTTDRFALRLF